MKKPLDTVIRLSHNMVNTPTKMCEEIDDGSA